MIFVFENADNYAQCRYDDIAGENPGSCSKSSMKSVTMVAGANAIIAFVSIGTAWSISSKDAVPSRIARGFAICIGLANTIIIALLSGRIVHSFVEMGYSTGADKYPSIPPHWLIVVCSSLCMGLGFLYRLARLVAFEVAVAACNRKSPGLSISADAATPSVGWEEEQSIGERATSTLLRTPQQQRAANPDSPLYSVRENDGRVRELLMGFKGSRHGAPTPAHLPNTTMPNTPSLPTYDNPEEFAYEGDERDCANDNGVPASAPAAPAAPALTAALAAPAVAGLPSPLSPAAAESNLQSDADLNASAARYLKYNSTLVAAVVATLCTTFTLSVNAWRSLSDSFAHGFLQCTMSLTTQGCGTIPPAFSNSIGPWWGATVLL